MPLHGLHTVAFSSAASALSSATMCTVRFKSVIVTMR